MKFIFPFLFAFIFISPVIADNICEDLSEQECYSASGCGWTGLDCIQCQPGTYSAVGDTECHSCANDPNYQAIISDQTKRHPRGASSCSDWECAEGYVQSGDSCITDLNCNLGEGQYLPTGSTSCDNWECNENYYLNSDQSACLSCPPNANSPAGSTSISQCNCPQGQDLINTNGTYSCGTCTGLFEYNSANMSCECNVNGANSNCECANHSAYNSNNNKCECTTAPYLNATYDGGVLTCSSCAENAIYENGCKCKVGYYGNGDTHCEKCPNNSTTDGAGSTSISACKCNIGFYDTESGTDSVSCTACPNNSTTDDAGSTSISACKCNIGYYDTESDTDSVSCRKCPIGMTTVTLVNGNPTNTTTNGATSIEHCAMLATSKFCFTNPDSTNRQLICTPLIPSSATKINDRTISTTTNSGN